MADALHPLYWGTLSDARYARAGARLCLQTDSLCPQCWIDEYR